MNDLTEHSATELAALIRARAVSPVEVVEAHLRRIESANAQLNAIVTLAPDAVEQARSAEAALMRGEARGALCGVPLTIKDTIATAGLRTTAGSKARALYVPEKDAPSVASLKRAGAIILGKTNAAEMAVGYESSNPVFGRTGNPYNLERTPGGSSGGEAAAIAACLSPAGLGSDLVGSIRIPAHFCGIAGLKPAPELVPAVGHLPVCAGALALGASIGPLARYVKDLALLFDVLAPGGAAAVDSARARAEGDALSEVKGIKLRGQRVAWYAYDGCVPVTEETRRVVEMVARVLAEAGLEAREERPPGVERGPALWHDLFAAEAAAQIAAEYAGREELAGPAVRAVLQRAGAAPPPDFSRRASALGERHRLRRALLAWMEETPLLVAPVGAVPAFAHGARKVMAGAQELSVFQAFSYAQTCNALGLPAVSVPVARSAEGLPIGAQLIARPGAERHLLAVALLIEEALGGYRPPPSALSPDADNPL